MAGNYGGSSLPTTPIAGAALVLGKSNVYKNFTCTAALDGTSFVYMGTTITMPADGQMIEMVINPAGVASQSGGVVFLCYDCSCNSPFSGITAPSGMYSGASSPMWKPVILGNGGVNS